VTLTQGPTRPGTSRLAAPLGSILTLAALGWAFAVHHGVGPVPPGGPRAWYDSRGWLLDTLAATSLGAWLDTPLRGLVAFTLPSAALATAVFATTRSSLARTLAVASLLATALFLFYGLDGDRAQIWTFFRWRGSAVMTLFALVLAAAVCAPFLATSWLRRGWPARLALFVPVAALVVVALRDVTGTNPRLQFAISPWPVVTMFGVEIGASVVAALLGVAALVLAVAGASRLAPASRALAGAGALVGIVGVPALIRPQPGLSLALLAGGIAGAALVVARLLAAPGRLAGAARALAVGTLLVTLPIVVGLTWVNHDYVATREGAAKQINDALQRYFAREQAYPDTLEELVEAKDLPAVPVPQVGFGVDGAATFTYENFGTSYILEFSAPRWVQCAYNPPWSDEAGDDGEHAAGAHAAASAPADSDDDDASGDDGAAHDGGADGTSMPGAWSCPRKPPELW